MQSLPVEIIDLIPNLSPANVFYGIITVLLPIVIFRKHLVEQVSDVAPNIDQHTILFGVGVFLFAFGGIELFNGSAAIALVSALTAFVAIYRLRRPDKTDCPAVRQSFKDIEDKDYMDFGLCNYGPGPALYLQVEATLASTGETLFKFKPRDYPLHLQEGDFLGFIHDDRLPSEESPNKIVDADEDEMINLYYSYVSAEGLREPEEWNNELERPDDTILQRLKRKSETPRRMEASKIVNQCSLRELEKSKASNT